MAGLSDRPPTYLSPRSADVVLSEIRPTKLAPEVLRSLNVLLDEFLWMILSTACSFSTEQLKAGLNRVLPTHLGKEALLEAEVELKAYWDRSTSTPSRPYAENAQEFPLQTAFELLRLKCEAYSTFNDTDEDADAEKRWQTKVASASGFSSFNVQFIAAGALYLTAIMEHVCEHILSNTGRVAARDSSRSTATFHDLFTALCEDDAIYGLFKNMKVYKQIEMQSKVVLNRPRRSKSLQRSASDHARLDTTQPAAKPRVSSDSIGSGAGIASGSRSSAEKSKAKKLFGRISMEREGSQNGHSHGHSTIEFGHKRSTSLISIGSSPCEVQFDQLMRSGTTMKVSLTPDRLRTFDVYNKEKGRGRINKIVIPPTAQTLPQQRQQEDQNVAGIGNGKDFNSTRMRKQSNGAPPVSYEASPHSRTRSASASQSSASSFASRHAVGRKGSLSAFAVESPLSQSLRGLTPANHTPRASESMSATLHTGRRAQQSVSHDSLDDILNGSEDEDAPVKKGAGRRRAPTGVRPQTADLIDFLNSGPPDLPKTMSPSASTSPSIDNKGKRGRLRSIVSRLTGGTSTEKLSSPSSFDDIASHGKRSLNHPPPAFVPPPLSAKRSLHSISSYAQNQMLMSFPKPPPPPVPPVSIPISPPLSPKQTLADCASGSPVRSRSSPISARKAVPTFTDTEVNSQAATSTSTVSLAAPKPPDVPPPTPSKVDSEANKPQAQTKPLADDAIALSSKAAVVPPTCKSSITVHPPAPVHVLRPSSKQSQRHAFTPPSTPSAFAAHAEDLRRLMANARTADECRLLVDMFLTQSGLPAKAAEFLPDPAYAPSAQQESAVVEALLSNGYVLTEKEERQESAPPVSVNGGHELGAPPTPRSDEHYPMTISMVSDMHSAPIAQAVVSAEA